MDTCRACLQLAGPDQLRPLFSDGISNSGSTAYLYSLLTSIETKPTKEDYICTYCEQKLLDFQHFREMCIASDQHIRANQQPIIIPTELSNTKAEPPSPGNDADDSDPFQCDAILADDGNNIDDSMQHIPDLDSATISKTRSEPAVQISNYNHLNTMKKSKLLCDLCGETFTTKTRIAAHLRVHFGLKPHACADCPEAFDNPMALRSHRLGEHSDTSHRHSGRLFPCEVTGCTRTYGTRYNLGQHVLRSHAKAPGQQMCETCGQVFHARQALTDHMYRHRDPSTYPYACDMCPKRFVNKYALDAHIKRHRNIRNFQCPACPQRTYSQYELAIHMEYHNKELTVQCEKCPNRFTTKMGLRRHMTRVHSGRKPYVCSHCGLGFAKKETMVNHTMRHTGEKPHACPICDQRFRQLVTMKTHLKVHRK